MTIRRVITGHDEHGRSVITSDGPMEPMAMPGMGDLYRIWSADEPDVFPNGGRDPGAAGIFPPVGGFRFFIFTLEPNKRASLDLTSSQDVAPDMAAVLSDDSGMHETDTTDFEVILSGEATLTVEGGQKVTLKRGEVIVHNGARHAWSNEGAETAVLAGCLIGARRER